MKLSLVVATGVHQGKAIPILVPQFLIGRDPECQLRPASPAISKKHCAFKVRGHQVFVEDFGSTNGTFVNDKQIEGEVEIKDKDRIKVGPLDFEVSLTGVPAPAAKPAAIPAASAAPADDSAADLLLDDDGPPAPPIDNPSAVPEGSTIMEVPVIPKPGEAAPGANPKSTAKIGNTQAAAAEILKKYQRRPRS